MQYHSARQYLGKAVIQQTAEAPLGLIESITINPKTMMVDGFLIGSTADHGQEFLSRECITEVSGDHLLIHKTQPLPEKNQRILGLQAWTTSPKFLVGFVYDVSFSVESGMIESFVIHQLIRTWRIPGTSVEKITPKALLINNDTTIKLKLTPYPTS